MPISPLPPIEKSRRNGYIDSAREIIQPAAAPPTPVTPAPAASITERLSEPSMWVALIDIAQKAGRLDGERKLRSQRPEHGIRIFGRKGLTWSGIVSAVHSTYLLRHQGLVAVVQSNNPISDRCST